MSEIADRIVWEVVHSQLTELAHTNAMREFTKALDALSRSLSAARSSYGDAGCLSGALVAVRTSRKALVDTHRGASGAPWGHDVCGVWKEAGRSFKECRGVGCGCSAHGAERPDAGSDWVGTQVAWQSKAGKKVVSLEWQGVVEGFDAVNRLHAVRVTTPYAHPVDDYDLLAHYKRVRVLEDAPPSAPPRVEVREEEARAAQLAKVSTTSELRGRTRAAKGASYDLPY